MLHVAAQLYVLSNGSGQVQRRLIEVSAQHAAAIVPGITGAGLSPFLLEYAAASPKTSTEALDELAGHPATTVRTHVAGNPSTSATALTLLAADTDPDVRCAVAQNPATPSDAALLLAADADPGVRRLSARWSGWNATGLRDIATAGHACDIVARNRNADDGLLRELSRSAAWPVVCGVAANPSTPLDVLYRLAACPERGARCAAATNPAIGPLLCAADIHPSQQPIMSL